MLDKGGTRLGYLAIRDRILVTRVLVTRAAPVTMTQSARAEGGRPPVLRPQPPALGASGVCHRQRCRLGWVTRIPEPAQEGTSLIQRSPPEELRRGSPCKGDPRRDLRGVPRYKGPDSGNPGSGNPAPVTMARSARAEGGRPSVLRPQPPALGASGVCHRDQCRLGWGAGFPSALSRHRNRTRDPACTVGRGGRRSGLSINYPVGSRAAPAARGVTSTPSRTAGDPVGNLRSEPLLSGTSLCHWVGASVG
eukprot:gene14565-biopygen179